VNNQKNNLGIVYFGSNCFLSTQVLRQLLQTNIAIECVLIHQQQQGLIPNIINTQAPLESLAHQNNITVTKFDSTQIKPWQKIKNHTSFKLALCVCFEKKIPSLMLENKGNVFINLHPSKLPKYRGPDPIFWQLHAGEKEIGVSLHIIEKNFDSGNIIATQTLKLEKLDTLESLELEAAKIGSKLIALLIDSNTRNKKIKSSIQSEAQASYFSWPDENDIIISTISWQRDRAYHFIKLMNSKFPQLQLNNFGQVYTLAVNTSSDIKKNDAGEEFAEFKFKDNKSLWIRKQRISKKSLVQI